MSTYLDTLLKQPVVPILFSLAAATLLAALVMYKPVYTALGRFFKSLSIYPPLNEEELRAEQHHKNIYMGSANPSALKEAKTPSPEPLKEAHQNPVNVQANVHMPDFGVAEGFKFGFGFAAGIMTFSFLATVMIFILFGTVIHSIMAHMGPIYPLNFPLR